MSNSHENMFSELDELFFTDGYRIASENLEQGINKQSLLRMSQKIYQYIEELLDAFKDQCYNEKISIECEKGCSFCCMQSVLVLPYELNYALHYLNTRVEENVKEKLIAAIKDKNSITGKLTVMDFFPLKKACPFLIKDECSIYPARPMGCRLHLSADMKSCENDYHHPKDENIFPALFEFPMRAGRMVNEGVCRYLSGKELAPLEWTIESGLSILLEDDTAFDKWLSGENVFKVRELSTEEERFLDKYEIIKKDDTTE